MDLAVMKPRSHLTAWQQQHVICHLTDTLLHSFGFLVLNFTTKAKATGDCRPTKGTMLAIMLIHLSNSCWNNGSIPTMVLINVLLVY